MLMLRDILDRLFERDDLLTHQMLADSLGVCRDTVRHWKRNTRLPSDEAMMNLSIRAGIRPLEGLLLLNIWRSQGRARAIYTKLLQDIEPTEVQSGHFVDGKPVMTYDSRNNT